MPGQTGSGHCRTGSWNAKEVARFSWLGMFCFSPKRWPSVAMFMLLSTCAVIITLQYHVIVRQKTLLVLDPSVRRVALRLDSLDPEVLRRISVDMLSKNKEVSLLQNILAPLTVTPTPINVVTKTIKTHYPVTLDRAYVLSNPKLCSSVPDLDVLVIVHTAPDHFERRQAMRTTWANNTYYSHLGKLRILFLLGRVKDDSLQDKIVNEFKSYGDILQGDFIDAYTNLTNKGVMGYKWITENCRNAKIILKTDDDIVVNSYKFFNEVVPRFHNKTKQIFCNHILPGTMLIIRKNNSKWHVEEDEFKGHKFYPRYCSGFMVVITNDVIPAIYRAASMTPFFWVDDVYLYGLLPGRVPGITYSGLKKGDHQLSAQNAINCYKNASRTCNFLVTGAGKMPIFKATWKFMRKQYEQSLKNHNTTSKPTFVTLKTDIIINKTDKVKEVHEVTREIFVATDHVTATRPIKT